MTPRQPLVMQPNLWKTFFVFLVPLIATNILQNLSGTINTIFVGQMMGVDAIAAVETGAQDRPTQDVVIESIAISRD